MFWAQVSLLSEADQREVIQALESEPVFSRRWTCASGDRFLQVDADPVMVLTALGPLEG